MFLLVMLALLLGVVLGGWLAQRAAERRARAAWATAALTSLTDVSAADLKRIIGHLPPWVRDAEFQKVAWLNTLVRQLWPYLDKAVATEVHAKAREELGKLSLAKFGIKSLSLLHFALGPPLKLCGVKVQDTGSADALVLDIDLRVAGAEPNAVVRVATVAGVELVIQLAALQLHTTARVTLSPLLPAPPFVGAVSVALLSIPFVDFSVTGLKGDLMALPGLEAAIAAGLKKGLAALIWPRRLVVPLLPDPDGYPALQPRSRGALLLRLRAARGLPVVDAAPGASIDPYMRVSVSGHDVVAETVKRRVTRSPTFDLETVLPVFDPATAVLQLELWDTNTLAADELVSTAELFVAELLSRQGQGGTAFSGWVPLQRCEGGLLDISAGLAVASAGVASAARSLRGLVVNADKSKAEQGAAVHPGGEALLEFTFVPFAPLGDGDEAPPQLPAGWELPATDRVLSVRLLRGEDLHPPAGWGRATPFVELRAGSTRYVSKMVPGTSPAWHELHELVLDLEAAPRLHLTVSAGPPKASAVDAVTGALNGAATVATMGVLGSRGGADELRLRGRTGGVLGRVPSCAAEAELPPAFDASFCGRAVVDLRDVERRCALASGPVCDTLPLQDIISGALVCVFEMRRLVAMPADGDANDVAVAAQPAEAEVAAPAAPTPVPAPSRRDALNVAAAAEAAEVLPLRETVVHDGIAVRKPNKRFSCFGGSD